MKQTIIVRDVQTNGNTGHITIAVQTEVEDGKAKWMGPLRQYGMDATMFRHRFQGDIEQVKAWIASEHQQYTGAHTEISEKLAGLKGQAIG